MNLKHITDEKIIRELRALAGVYHEQNNFIGMSIGIVSGGRAAYLPFGVMEKDGAEVDEFTLFDIGSLTKTFTGILFADLVSEGKLKFDDTLQSFYPELKIVPKGDTPILLEHLATHSSGFTKFPYNYGASVDKSLDDFDRMFAYGENHMFEFMQNANLLFTPGTKYEYSNIGVTILGCIEAKADGKPFNQILQERICKKLGMESTATRLSAEQEKIHIFGHDENGEIIRKQYTPDGGYYMLEACGGIKSNACDMVNYIAANLGSFDTALLPSLDESQKIHFDNNGGFPKMGLGWHIVKHGDGLIYTHGGWVGGHRSYIAFSREKNCGAVVMINRNGNPDSLCLQLLDRLVSE